MGDFAIFPGMGNNLKTLRKAARMTHEKAAEAMGVSKGQFIKLERGERRLTIDYINQAAKAFGVSSSEVIDDTPSVVPVRPELAVRLADLFAKVMRLNPDVQARIADLIEDELTEDQGNLRDTVT